MLHVFKHSNSYHTLRLPVIPGKRKKTGTGAGVQKGLLSENTNHGPWCAPTGAEAGTFHFFPPAGFTHRIRGGHPSWNHGVHWAAGTYCLPNREHMPEKNPGKRPPVSRRARGVLCSGTPLRGNKGEENDGEGEKNQCRARQLVGDMPSHCLNEREKEF